MAWIVHEEVLDDGTVHVWPEHEAEHEVTGFGCWCGVHVTRYDNGNARVVHRDDLDRMQLDWEVYPSAR